MKSLAEVGRLGFIDPKTGLSVYVKVDLTKLTLTEVEGQVTGIYNRGGELLKPTKESLKTVLEEARRSQEMADCGIYG